MGEGERAQRAGQGEGDPLEGVDWGRVYAEALVVARKVVREQDVDDVVNEGLRRVIDGTAPWDQAKAKTLAGHVVRVGTNVRKVQVRKVQVRKVERRASGTFVAEVSDRIAQGAPADPEEKVVTADEKAKRLQTLVAACADDGDALAVIGCAERGIDEPAEQAAATGLDIEAVRNARKRLKRRIEALVEEGGEP